MNLEVTIVVQCIKYCSYIFFNNLMEVSYNNTSSMMLDLIQNNSASKDMYKA